MTKFINALTGLVVDSGYFLFVSYLAYTFGPHWLRDTALTFGAAMMLLWIGAVLGLGVSAAVALFRRQIV